MVGSRLNVRLYRDSFNTPWGFRLQGGKDLNQPLVVQRVFSNSPAEGELQRGDVILSINSRDAGQLTHKQAQDLIKHGGGQVQLVVNRPPLGTHLAPLSPPIVTQQPRAPSLQDVRHRPPQPRPTQISMYDRDYSNHSHNSPMDYRAPQYQGGPMHVQITAQPERSRTSWSQPPTTPTPTTPTPPWAAQQAPPKRVSKLSRLGGGGSGYTFGTDYATLPRHRSPSAHYGATHARPRAADMQDGTDESVEPDRLASGPVPKVCNIRNLGGGGYQFGSSFGGSSTLPRKTAGRRLSQPGMPGAAGYGHVPKKVTLNRIGGGGPEYGSDFGRVGQTPAQRVQTSLDTITLSPRTPEPLHGSPFFPSYEPSPPSHHHNHHHHQAPPPPQQVYTPTGLILEQQRLQEQRQQQEMDVLTPSNRPPPRVLKPKPGPTSYADFGTDYSHPQTKQSAGQWRPAQPPAPQQVTPAPVYVPVVQCKPSHACPPAPAPRPVVQLNLDRAAAPEWHPPAFDGAVGVPAWRNTLKSSSGVKPWEQEAVFGQEHQPVRSVPYSPNPPSQQPPSYPTPTQAPFSPTQTPAVPMGGEEDGPQVVHLQYNSPMGLYSNQNVAETLKGQTQAISGQTKPPQSQTNQSGDRDWTQSCVLRFIQQEDKRGVKNAPPTAPKPQHQYQQAQQQFQHQQQPFYDDIGASDF